jgi:outer membrane protein TolC
VRPSHSLSLASSLVSALAVALTVLTLLPALAPARALSQAPPEGGLIDPRELIRIDLDAAYGLADAAAGAPSGDASATPSGAATFITLPEAIALGLERSFRVEAADASINKAKAVQGEADWAWTPKLEFDSYFVPMPKLQADDADFDVFDRFGSWGVYTKNDFRLNMPLFTFFKISTAQDLAAVGVSAEEVRKIQEQLLVIVEVARAYYGLQLANASFVVLDDAQEMLDKANATLGRLLDEGKANVSKSDRYQIEIAEADFNVRRLQAQQGQRYATDALRVHTRIEGPLSIPKMRFIPDEVVFKPLEDVIDYALAHRVDLQLVDRGLNAQRLKLKMEKLQWTPDLFFSASLNYAYSNAVAPIPDGLSELYIYDPYNSFGFGFIFGLRWRNDPVQRTYKIEQESFELTRVEALRELARRGATLDVQQAYFNVANAQNSVQVIRKSRRAATRRMTQLYSDYESGSGNVDLLSRSVVTYFEQRTSFLKALHDFRIAAVQLQLATGATDLDALIDEGFIHDYKPDADAEDEDDE